MRYGLGGDPTDGGLYVFVNRRATQMRVLYFDRSGFCIGAKRLEAGRFLSDWSQVEVIGQKVSYRLAQRTGSYVVLKYVRPLIKRLDTQAIGAAPASSLLESLSDQGIYPHIVAAES